MKFKTAIQILSSIPPSPNTPRTSKSSFAFVQEKLREQDSKTAEEVGLISGIRSVEDLHVEWGLALSIKRGDLALIQGDVFRCTPIDPRLSHHKLVLKRLDCVDRMTYDMKIHEAATLARFTGHPNLVSLYSYWTEKPSTPYVFKTLNLLLKEGEAGDMLRTIIFEKKRPPVRLCLKLLCDICKGLVAIHSCNIIHGRVKPSSIYLTETKTAMLGEFGKTEIDLARRTHQLFSKVLIGEAIPRTLVYWAPELLRLEPYGMPIDMWALGVTLYQLVTGQHPFCVEDEARFREDVLMANVNMEPLKRPGYELLAEIIVNLLRVNPNERWSAQDVLNRAQHTFAVTIQHQWLAHKATVQQSKLSKAATLIRATWLAHNIRRKYLSSRDSRLNGGALTIQLAWRRSRAIKEFKLRKHLVLFMQACVLAWQGRRAFVQYRNDTVVCQSLVRRFLCQNWFRKVREQRKILEAKLLTIQTMIAKYQKSFEQFSSLFRGQDLPSSVQYLQSFENYELHKAAKRHAEAEDQSAAAKRLAKPDIVCLPMLRAASAQIGSLESQLAGLKARFASLEESQAKKREEEIQLRVELGSKYEELNPMIEALKQSLRRVEEACKRSRYLPVTVQHPYQYTKWDIMHEPDNIVENLLREDESVYRSLSPCIDLTLADGVLCFVAQIELSPGDCGPASVEVYSSNVVDKWTFVKTFQCTRDPVQIFRMPGEQLCKYIRIRSEHNIRGGNIVSIREVKIKGLVQQ